MPFGTLNKKEKNYYQSRRGNEKDAFPDSFPKKMRRIAEYASAHHEKMDGTGYPTGLKGNDITLQSRIIALADIFEAITAKDRPYKKGKKRPRSAQDYERHG